MVSSARTIFGSILTGAFIAILTNKLPGQMQSKVVPSVIKAGLPESSVPKLMAAVSSAKAEALKAVPGMNPDILTVTMDSVSDSYSASYAYVYYFCVALGGLSIIAAVCCREFDHYLTDHVSRRIHEKTEINHDPLGSSSDSDSANGSPVTQEPEKTKDHANA